MAYGTTDAEIARGLLQWLRGDGLPPPLQGMLELERQLARLRLRMSEPSSALAADFPMGLELAARGQRSCAEVFELCAMGDVVNSGTPAKAD